jgi:hypothetical protein
MAKQHKATIRSVSVGVGSAAARAIDPVMKAARAIDPLAESTATAPKHEQIARLAYFSWQGRGCPEGSPDEDWLRAETELEKQVAGTVA